MYNCWQSHLDYSWSSSHRPGTLKTMDYYAVESWEANENPAKTTLCDDLMRYLEPRRTLVTLTKYDWSAVTYIQDKPLPYPACSLNQDQCSYLHSAFTTTRWSLWNSFNSIRSSKLAKSTQFRSILFEPNTLKPPCETITTCPKCQLRGFSPTVFYWPTGAPEPSDLGCSESITDSLPSLTPLPGHTSLPPVTTSFSSPPSSATPTSPILVPTPRTAVVLGHTITFPSALVIFATLGAITPTAGRYSTISTCGPDLRNVKLTIAQSDLSTETLVGIASRFHGGTISAASFNLAHLAAVPYSRAISPQVCLDLRLPRDKITKDRYCPSTLPSYEPTLIVPAAARKLYPLWSACDLERVYGLENLGYYISITAETMNLPSATYYGRTQMGDSQGPLFSTIVPLTESTNVHMMTPMSMSPSMSSKEL
jgi:hypothetical protein